MQARAPRVVGNANLGPEALELFNRLGIGCRHVRRRQDAQAPRASLEKASELGLHDADAVPLHERDDDVDRVGRCELAADLAPDAQVARSVDEQVAVTKRKRRARDLAGPETCVGLSTDGEQELGRLEHGFVGVDAGVGSNLSEECDEAVREGDLMGEAVVLRKVAERAHERIVEVTRFGAAS